MLIDKKQQQLGITIIRDMPTEPDIQLLSTDMSWVVISFLSNSDDRALLEHCKEKNVSIHKVIKVQQIVEKYSLTARTHYRDFISN